MSSYLVPHLLSQGAFVWVGDGGKDRLPPSPASRPLGEGGLDKVSLGGRLEGREAGRGLILQDEGEVGDVDPLEALVGTQKSSPGSGLDLLWVWFGV